MKQRDEDALDYHSSHSRRQDRNPGYQAVSDAARFASMAYTPGVALPCLLIEKDPLEAFRYTGRGNLVAVVTNGTAVLGLGNIGALAGKPVMEGKAVLFKKFRRFDVFDIEIDAQDPDEIIRFVPNARAYGRRDQPGRHQGAGVLLHRRAPSSACTRFRCFMTTSTAPRSSARSFVQRTGSRRQAYRKDSSCVQRRGRGGDREREHCTCSSAWRPRTFSCAIAMVCFGKAATTHGPVQAAFVCETSKRSIAEALEGADVFVGVSAGVLRNPRYGGKDGETSDRVCDGESRSGNHV